MSLTVVIPRWIKTGDTIEYWQGETYRTGIVVGCVTNSRANEISYIVHRIKRNGKPTKAFTEVKDANRPKLIG